MGAPGLELREEGAGMGREASLERGLISEWSPILGEIRRWRRSPEYCVPFGWQKLSRGWVATASRESSSSERPGLLNAPQSFSAPGDAHCDTCDTMEQLGLLGQEPPLLRQLLLLVTFH